MAGEVPQANLLEEKPRLHDDQGLNNPVAFSEPLAFTSSADVDSDTNVIETISMDETPRLFDEPESSNVTVGMGQKDAFMEQTNPIAEQSIEEQPPVIGYLDVDVDDDYVTKVSDDDDGFDVS